METKTSKALALWRGGQKIKALSIFKTFKIGFTKEEQDIITIAHEMSTVGELFYKQLGFSKDKVIQEAICIIEEKYKL